MRMSFAHKREHSFEQRIAESARVRERYNDRVPVICEKTPSSDMPCEDKCPMPAPPTLPHARAHPPASRARASTDVCCPCLSRLVRSKYLIPMDMTVCAGPKPQALAPALAPARL